MPATLDRRTPPPEVAEQLARLERLLAEDGMLLTCEVERELGLVSVEDR